jgi:hypothetical protein
MARDAIKLTAKVPDLVEVPAEAFTQRKRPLTGRFHLQVDRQTKRSYPTIEAAEEAGLLIKKSHPVVQVAVYDSIEFVNKIIDLP